MEQIDIEKLLQEGKIVQTKLRGYSMYPLFVPGREDVRIESCRQDSLHRYAATWLFFRPCRPVIGKIVHFFKSRKKK